MIMIHNDDENKRLMVVGRGYKSWVGGVGVGVGVSNITN